MVATDWPLWTLPYMLALLVGPPPHIPLIIMDLALCIVFSLVSSQIAACRSFSWYYSAARIVRSLNRALPALTVFQHRFDVAGDFLVVVRNQPPV